jgi:hypothetical protein
MAIKYKDMAIQYQQIRNKLKTDPLTEEELKLISEAEEYIDSEIEKQFGKGYYFEVNISLNIVNFNYSKKRKTTLDLNQLRKNLMRDELDKRYKKAGWSITIKFDDGLDGPMSGDDYWVLKGKK